MPQVQNVNIKNIRITTPAETDDTAAVSLVRHEI